MLKINNQTFDELNKISKEIDNEISKFISNLNNFYEKYKENNMLKEFLIEFFNIKNKNIFTLDFSLPKISKELNVPFINLEKMNMNKESEYLYMPIINIDSEG